MLTTLGERGRSIAVMVSGRLHADELQTRKRMWDGIYLLVTGITLWQGIGYAFAGGAATTQPGWAILTSRYLLGAIGGLRAHGVIMLLLGLTLLAELRGPRGMIVIWTLRVLRTYALIVSLCWFVSWPSYGVNWGAPAWWALLVALTVWLAIFDPYAAQREIDAVRARRLAEHRDP